MDRPERTSLKQGSGVMFEGGRSRISNGVVEHAPFTAKAMQAERAGKCAALTMRRIRLDARMVSAV